MMTAFRCLQVKGGPSPGLGPPVIAMQCGLLWCLRRVLRWVGRWAHQGLWWCIDHAQSAVQTWRREHRR